MTIRKILIPYNFTSFDDAAIDFVIKTFADQKDTKITLFHTYLPLPTVDVEANPEMRKMGSGLSFLATEIREKEGGLKSAKDFLIENGFSDDQIDYVFKERKSSIADEIIETLLNGHYKIVVLSRQGGKVNRFLARSIHEKILSRSKNITVCIAT
jgi:hypothetical protein